MLDMFGEVHEECGVFGIYDTSGCTDVVKSAYYALYALQHRGQESCGIAVNDDGVISLHKNLGLVHEVFTPDVLKSLSGGSMSLGHVRYSTTGETLITNAQPMFVHHIKGSMAVAHNGNLTNAAELRETLELTGAIFHTTSDTEVISYTVTRARLTEGSIEKSIEKAMYSMKGAYSMIIMSPQKLIAARDPFGFRPLCMGKKGDAVLFASESCALHSLGADFVRDIEPGEIVVAGPDGLTSIRTHCGGRNHLCVFEYVYFARSDSVIEGVSVHEARKRAGAILARDYRVCAVVVIGVPDCGLDAALGYAEESGIPYGVGFIKNRYIGRTFIQPNQDDREDAVRIKLSALKSTVQGKRVVLIEDSIVRGTTSRRTINLIKEAGATEIHMRVSSPPFINPCYFGTDIDSKENLIANKMTVPDIAKMIGVDSLGYLSIEGVKSIASDAHCAFCTGCFDGAYPSPPPAVTNKNKFEIRLSEAPKTQ
jgi:amidophosphoribosyltransferase